MTKKIVHEELKVGQKVYFRNAKVGGLTRWSFKKPKDGTVFTVRTITYTGSNDDVTLTDGKENWYMDWPFFWLYFTWDKHVSK